MNRRRILILMLIAAIVCLMSAGVGAAEEVNITLEGHFGGVTLASAVSGNHAYVGQGQDLVVLDISNLAQPLELGRIHTDDFVNDICISGSYAYVADWCGGFVIINISNPAAPVLAGSYDTSGYSYGVAVLGSYAYVADHNNGLVIVDISNPAAPVFVGSYAGRAQGVAVSGSYAYVAGYANGLVIINISNPAAPVLAGSYNTAGDALGVAVSGSYAYVADHKNGLVIVDISNPAAPTLAGSYDTAGYAMDVAVSGSYAYVADMYNGLVIVDISNPAAPVLAGSYDTAGNACGVAVLGSYAYVADSYYGLVIVDISNPVAPVLASSYYDTVGNAYDVAVSGSYAYVTDDRKNRLVIIDINNPAAPVFGGSYDTAGSAYGVAISGSYAYVVDYTTGLVIIDINNPTAPVLAGSYYTAGNALGVAVSGNYAYIADNTNGLVIIDISNPAAPVLAGSYDTAGTAYDVAVSDSYAYIADNTNGLVIIDISNPAVPVLAGSYDTAGNALGVAVSGSYAYVADWYGGFVIIDISNPAVPVLAGSYDTAGNSRVVAVSGSYAYVADNENGLVIIDISNPAAYLLAGSYNTPGSAYDVAVLGSYAYVADYYNGLVILRTDASDTDTIPPTLTIASPTNGSTVTTPTIIVTGTASDDTAIASVTVNGTPATGITTWSANITLIEGTNTITVVATDTSSNTATETITIIYTPTTDAEITSTSFDSGYFAENDKIKTHVTVKNNGTVTHTFYVGYTVQDPVGKYYDAPYKSITLSPGQTDTVDIDWTVPWIDAEHLGSFKAITAIWDGEKSSGLTGQLDTYVKENAFTIARYNGGYLVIKSITPNEATRGVAALLEIEFENVGDKPFIKSDATVTIQEMDSGRLGGGDQVNYIAKKITIPTINPGATYTWKFGIYDGIYFGKILTDYITVKVEPENGEIVNSHPDVKPFDVHPNPIEYIDVTAGVIGTLIGNGEVDEYIKNILKAESTASTLTNLFTVSAPNKDFKSVGINIGKLIIALKPNPVSVLWSTTSTGLALSELILYHGGQDLINGIVEIFSSIGEDIGAILADCPINLMIIDEYGNRLGIDENGTIYEEIPDSSVIVIGNDTNKSILLIYPASGNYTTIVSGTDDGTFDMLLAVANNGNVTSVNYTGILTTNNSIAKVQINDTSDYSITIDSDGDGIIDNVTSPSSLLIYQVPEVIISEPINGTQYEKDYDIIFQGLAYDQYSNIINNSNLQWSSNIDGLLGIGNNINISNLSIGKHIIYLKAIDNEGHYGINDAHIEIQPKMGGINVTSLPSNASILLDGVSTGEKTPYLFTNISEGIHQIEIKLSGYNDYVFDLNVSHNNILYINAIMDLDIYPPEIFINSPSNGTTTNSSVIALKGTIENNAILNINDQNVSVVNNSFNVSINLQTGINIITMTATDTSGNNATDTISITYTPISGDFSGDGTTDSWDITYLARSLVLIPGYDTQSSGDLSGDGVVDVWDCTYLARVIAGVPGYSV